MRGGPWGWNQHEGSRDRHANAREEYGGTGLPDRLAEVAAQERQK